MADRKIKKIVTGTATQDGAGVHLVRVIGYRDVKDFDPFLMLDAFDSKNPEDYIKGFPFHPHRGIETVTYLISGDILHRDSLGNSGSIIDGSCQWMTAGSGIIHEEMPQPSDWMLGAQLWVNLPQKDKMTEPTYRDIHDENIPKIEENGARIGVLCGQYGKTKGAMKGDYVDVTYLDVALEQGASWSIDTPQEHTVFIYIILGSVITAEEEVPAKRAVLFTEGGKLVLKGGKDGARFLFLMGKKLNEPVAWGGPIVMNTEEELDLAFTELQQNTFIKHKKPKGI